MSQKPQIVFVLGGPGSGKGSKDAQIIKQKMRQGQMVESRPIVELLKKKITSLHKQNTNRIYMIDGFPRNFQNQETWQSVIGRDFTIRCLIDIQCNNEELVKRLIERGKTSGRADDNSETIRKRMATFEAETEPVIRQYKRKYYEGGILVLCINGMFSIADTAKSINQKLKHHGII